MPPRDADPAEGWRELTELDAARCIAVPGPDDDKYSRGVLGMLTGSPEYPGAAVLGVEAATRTGVGMVRYLAEERPTDFVLRARPEVVTSDGRVQAWLAGSGTDASSRSPEAAAKLDEAIRSGLPLVLDAGALDRVDDVTGLCILTPHAGELQRLLEAHGERVDRTAITTEPRRWALAAARLTGCTVLLKGFVTHICSAEGDRLTVTSTTSWTATAGAGDVLAGALGALVATNAARIAGDPDALVSLAATGALLHARAAALASGGGPIVALDIAQRLPAVVAELSSGRPA
ncbi:NAD(P)H-hydrate dehydratase [Cnuibacter sp. UC19_7]|uniref:ADP-dependent NAD(P)H-hydrate dehydratase n=1 Tax=Cnuibacter sp. UC19_7 TaxID=3350166 RepID=UPI003672D1FD